MEDVNKVKLPTIKKCDTLDHVVHYAMMQLSLKAGLKQFGKEGADAVIKELKQHHGMSTF